MTLEIILMVVAKKEMKIKHKADGMEFHDNAHIFNILTRIFSDEIEI